MDLEKIEALLQLLSEHDVSEFQFKDDDIRLRLRLGPPAATQVMSAAPAPVALAAAPLAAVPAVADAPAAVDDGLTTVECPMVGTFYRAPSPGASSFVEVGTRVTTGQVLCIVEAMKLMNEIEAELAGEIVEICIENAQSVQFGQPLFKIRPA